jgi:aminopeptidase N
MERLDSVTDVFHRTLLWGSLWDSVREAELAPREFLELALSRLPAENDETLTQSLVGHVAAALHRYVNSDVRTTIVPKAESLAAASMGNHPDQSMRIIWFRALRSIAETANGRSYLKSLLLEKMRVPGVELRPLDRWTMIAALIALNDPDADALYAAEQKRDNTGDGQKYAYVAAAARPAAGSKKEYFDDYLHNTARPEDWVEQSLGAFNYWNQSELTLPYLKPALEALPQVKRQRKIFFVLGWLNAFIGGQQSSAALAQVQEFIRTATLDKDLRLKILEVSDELVRTVRVRHKFK